MNFKSYPAASFYQEFPAKLREDTLRILMIGDVVGHPGRKILKNNLSQLKESLKLNFVTINGENLAGGFGITEKIYEEMIGAGVDVITMGNHWADKPDVHRIAKAHKNLVLPQNLQNDFIYPHEFEIPGTQRRVCVVNLMGQFAMKDSYADPFAYMQKFKSHWQSAVNSGNQILLVDMHAEANSEKQAAAYYLDGVCAGMIGTHTHTPTGDERLSAKGTAYLTDVGMTGPYNSVLGMDRDRSLNRFLTGQRTPHEVAKGDSWLCGFLVEISVQTGLAVQAHRLQLREEKETWTISTIN